MRGEGCTNGDGSGCGAIMSILLIGFLVFASCQGLFWLYRIGNVVRIVEQQQAVSKK